MCLQNSVYQNQNLSLLYSSIEKNAKSCEYQLWGSFGVLVYLGTDFLTEWIQYKKTQNSCLLQYLLQAFLQHSSFFHPLPYHL